MKDEQREAITILYASKLHNICYDYRGSPQELQKEVVLLQWDAFKKHGIQLDEIIDTLLAEIPGAQKKVDKIKEREAKKDLKKDPPKYN